MGTPPAMSGDNDKQGDGRRVIKTRFKHLFGRNDWSDVLQLDATRVIESAVRRNHVAVTRAYILAKLLLLERLENLGPDATAIQVAAVWPKNLFTIDFFKYTLTVVSEKGTCGPKPKDGTLRTELEDAHAILVSRGHLPEDKVDARNLTYTFGYSASEMVTAYKNNVEMRYPQYVRRMLNVVLEENDAREWGVSSTSELSKEARRELRSAWNVVKDDVFQRREPRQCAARYHQLLDIWTDQLCPAKPDNAQATWSILTGISKAPTLYLAHMAIINRHLEAKGAALLSPFCQRRRLVPSHMRIDTQGLIELLVADEFAVRRLRANMEQMPVDGECSDVTWALPKMQKTADMREKVIYLTDMEKMGDMQADPRLPALYRTAVWRAMTKLGSSAHVATQLGDAVFNNVIDTDGYSVSLHYVRPEGYGATKFNKLDTRCKKSKADMREAKQGEFKNLLDLDQQSRERLLDESVTLLLAGDPGKTYLITLTDGTTFLSYSARQRRAESSVARNASDHRHRIRQSAGKVCQGRSFQDLQDALCEGSSKSCSYSRYASYLEARWAVEKDLGRLYKRQEYRRASFRAFSGRMSSDARFAERVKKHFLAEGDTRDIEIAWGDWGRSTNLKHSAPSPGVGYRRRCGLASYTNPESGTSKVCYRCEQWGMDNPKLRCRKSCCANAPTPTALAVRKRAHESHVHSLLRCQNVQCASRWWNRDPLASLNQLKNARHILCEGVSHPCFRRPKVTQDT